MNVAGARRGMLIENQRPLSTGGKMGKFALVVALVVGLCDSAFSRDALRLGRPHLTTAAVELFWRE
jgi:hypothetical protein